MCLTRHIAHIWRCAIFADLVACSLTLQRLQTFPDGSVAFSGRHDKWLKFKTFKGTILDVLNRLSESGLTDQSDPDVDIPNVYHGFQTAEGIRKVHPDKEWFQLTGLIHDIGKIMALYDEPQWACLGDTFVVGCEVGPSVVYRDTSFVNNPDTKHPVYR